MSIDTWNSTDRLEVIVDRNIADASEHYAKAEALLTRMQRELASPHGRNSSLRADLPTALAARNSARDLWIAATSGYRGWSRFYLVQNVGGHIHRDTSCETCYPSTQYAWLVELSGLTEAEAVAEYGAILCSRCYPSAPVEWTMGTNKKEDERKALHKALSLIERSPEGKKVKSARELVSRHEYNLGSLERDIARLTERADLANEHDDPSFDHGAAFILIITKQDRIDQKSKLLAKAQAKLVDAVIALDTALEAS
mgnify:FL=1